ncbi:hypothetical protein L543_3757 [Bordetella hinzii L60]|nr:hypothetical protein L543_3757 [Bordetella hinzii L60]
MAVVSLACQADRDRFEKGAQQRAALAIVQAPDRIAAAGIVYAPALGHERGELLEFGRALAGGARIDNDESGRRQIAVPEGVFQHPPVLPGHASGQDSRQGLAEVRVAIGITHSATIPAHDPAQESRGDKVVGHRPIEVHVLDKTHIPAHQATQVIKALHLAAHGEGADEGADAIARQGAGIVCALDLGIDQADIPDQAGDIDPAEQSRSGLIARDVHVAYHMALPIQAAAEQPGTIADRLETLGAPHPLRLHGEVARQEILAVQLVGHQLQLMIIADANAVFAGQHGPRLAFDHDPLGLALGVLGHPDIRAARGLRPVAERGVTGVLVAEIAVDAGDARVQRIEAAHGIGQARGGHIPMGVGEGAGHAVADQPPGQAAIDLAGGIGIGHRAAIVARAHQAAHAHAAVIAIARDIAQGIGIAYRAQVDPGQAADIAIPATDIAGGVDIVQHTLAAVIAHQAADEKTAALAGDRHPRIGIDDGPGVRAHQAADIGRPT